MALPTIDQSAVVPDTIDPSQVVLDGPPKPRGSVAELGTALGRAAVVGLPTAIGKSLQFTGIAPETGAGMVASAEQRGQSPSLTRQPENHGSVFNTVADVIEGSGAFLPAAAAGVAGLAFPPALAAVAPLAVGGGTVAGLEQGQNTKEAVMKAGGTEDQANAAGLGSAAVVGAANLAGGLVFRGMVKAATPAVTRMANTMMGKEAPELAGDVASRLSQGAIGPVLKQLPMNAAELTAINAGQAAAVSGIESANGVENADPLNAAVGSIPGSLATAGMLGLGSMAARGVANARARRAEAPTPAAPEAAPVEQPAGLLPNNPSPFVVFPDGTVGRSQAEVDSYINGLPADQQNAARAKLMGLGAQPNEVPAAAPEAPAALPAPEPGKPTMYTFPDGTTSTSIKDVESYVQSLPENQQGAAMAQLLGIGPQAAVMAKSEFAENSGLKGQKLAKEYATYRKDPAAYEQALRDEQAAAQAGPEAPGPDLNVLPEQPAKPTEAPRLGTQLADALEAARTKAQVDAAYAELDTRKAAETEKIANIAKGEQQAAAAEAGTVEPNANAPKQGPEIRTDLDAALAANGETPRKQDVAWLQNKLAQLGIDQLPTHQAQIDALQAAVDATKKASPGFDRLKMLLDSWKAPESRAEPPAQTPAPTEPTPVGNLADQAVAKAVTPTTPATPGAPVDVTPTEAKVTRAPDFKDSGNYDVKVGDQTGKIYRDPESGWWYREDFPGESSHFSRRQVGFSKTEAVAAMQEQLAARAGLGDNIPEAAPDTAGQPPAAQAISDTLPANTDRRQALADRVDALVADMNTRVRAGEKFTPLEQERYDDLHNFRKLLSASEGNAKGAVWTPEYLQDLESYVNEASQPYKESHNQLRFASETPDMGILAKSILSHRVQDLITDVAANSEDPGRKALADKLAALDLPTKVYPGFLSARDRANLRENEAIAGRYNHADDTIEIFPEGATEQTVLHETVHAATLQAINKVESVLNGKAKGTQQDVAARRAYQDLEAIRQRAILEGGIDQVNGTATNATYGLTNMHEFVAELHTNPEFQQFLQDHGGKTSLWDKAVDAVRKLLGMTAIDRDVVSRAMAASERFFDLNQQLRTLNDPTAAPNNLTGAADNILQRAIFEGDKMRVDTSSMERGAFEKTLGWRTLESIADGVRRVPGMVASGFQAGVDAHRAALQSGKLAAAHLNSAIAPMAKTVHDYLGKMKGDAARDLSQNMMFLAGEGSRMGVDITQNFADNLKAGRTLDLADKPYVDDLYRQYAQLKAQHPEMAKALVDGAKTNRQMLDNTVATIVANQLAARAGVARRLQAELTRMDPADAAFAQATERSNLANQESTLEATHSRGLDFMDPTAKGKVMQDRINAAFADARKLPVGSPLRASMGELENLYRRQASAPYYSLGRSGDYFVNVNFKDMTPQVQKQLQDVAAKHGYVLGDLRGQNNAFFRMDSADAAQGLLQALHAAGGDKVTDSSAGLLAQYVNKASGITPALRQLFESIDDTVTQTHGNTADAQQLKAALQRQLLQMLPETAGRSAKIQRKGVPGYDADFLGNYVKRAQGTVGDLSNLYTSRAFTVAAKQRADAIEAMNRGGLSDDAVRAQMVDNEINQRYTNSLTPLGKNPLVSALNGAGYAYYLGLSPAYFIRAMAQPWHRGLPALARGGYSMVSNAKELAAATPAAMKLIAESFRASKEAGDPFDVRLDFRNLGLSPAEQAFAKEMNDRGIYNLGAAHQLAQLAEGGKTQQLAKLSGMVVQYAESANRFALSLAAYRQAINGGMTPAKAADFAAATTNRAMDNFDPSNTARMLSSHNPVTGKATPLIAMFQNYNLQTMQQLISSVHDGWSSRTNAALAELAKDQSPEGKAAYAARVADMKGARAEFRNMMATTAMLSGAMGLPFVNAFAGIYNSLANLLDPDNPSDIRTSFRNNVSAMFGPEVEGLISHGPAYALGMDTSTLGLGDLLPGSDFLQSRQKWSDRVESQASQLLGPALNGVMDIAVAAGKMADGNWVKGVEQILPPALRNLYKVGELTGAIGPGGYLDSQGNPMNIPVDARDIALQAVGFQSAKRAEVGEAQRDFSANTSQQQARRQVLLDRVFKGVTQNDPQATANAMQDIAAFNAANPLQAITNVTDGITQKLTAQALAKASGTGVNVSKKQLPILMQDEAFAAHLPRY